MKLEMQNSRTLQEQILKNSFHRFLKNHLQFKKKVQDQKIGRKNRKKGTGG